MILLMNFTDPRLPVNSLTEGKSRLPLQVVNVPMDAVRYLTKISGFLLIKSSERNRYQEFDPASFFAPDVNWTPPYPYCPQDVLFLAAVSKTESPTAPATHPFPFEELLERSSLKEQFLATEDPGG
jgi:hypothetical protein